MRFDEALLDHIKRVFLIVQNPVSERVDATMVALIQDPERLLITSAGALDQRVIVGRIALTVGLRPPGFRPLSFGPRFAARF